MNRLRIVRAAERAYGQFHSVATTGNVTAQAHDPNEHRHSTDLRVGCRISISLALSRGLGSGGHRRLGAAEPPETSNPGIEFGRDKGGW
jgi:hypothetical protein